MPVKPVREQEGMALQGYLWIMLGSALGGAGRYWCFGLAARLFGETFPWGTLIVNVTGSFAIGLADALASPHGRLLSVAPSREFLMAGLCGGFTTFSAFSLQTLSLVRDDRLAAAGLNVGASVGACLASVWLGEVAGIAMGRAWS